MKILLEHLRTFTAMPEDPRACRELLDDVGIEVKTVEHTELGTVFNVELLANRGDHYCYEGIAREVNGRTGGGILRPPVLPLRPSPAKSDRIRVETPLCLVYTLTELRVPDDAPAMPAAALAPMLAAGMQPNLPSVDASNIVNLEIGQPTHAFDADTIDGPVTIRTSRKGEKAWLLFTPEAIEIPEGTLVIADESKILGIAGVIGCEESRVTGRTRRIVLESACFDPTAVRIASRQLNQATDAAARFMRGGDPSLPLAGAGRVAHLLAEHCGYQTGEALIAGEWSDPRQTIEIDVARTARFTGAGMSASEMINRLTRYGFAVELGERASNPDKLRVIVPPHRIWDVHFEADIAEELLKSAGYNATEVSLPPVSMGAVPSHRENVIARTSEVLVSEGFYEIFTDSFYSRRVRERLGLPENDPLWDHVETQNSIEKDYSLLRNNTLAQALDALAANVNVRNANLKMYEWARIFIPDPSAANGVCREQAILWGLANGRDRGPFWADKGRPADAIFLKGIIEQLRYELRLDLRTGPVADYRLARFLHPGRSAGVYLADRLIGMLGEVHPAILARFDIKRQRPAYFEIETEALFESPQPRLYREPSARQPVLRNLAYAIPAGITAEDVSAALRDHAPEFLRDIRVTDVYEIPDDPSQARAVTFEIEYLADEALTGDTINAATEAMMKGVEQRLGNRVALRG